MTATDPIRRSVQDAIEQLIVDYPEVPVGTVVRTATAAVRSVTMMSDIDQDRATVAYLIARQQLDFLTGDIGGVQSWSSLPGRGAVPDVPVTPVGPDGGAPTS